MDTYDRNLKKVKAHIFGLLDAIHYNEIPEPIRVNKKYLYLIDPVTLVETVKELFTRQMGDTAEAYTAQAQAAYRTGAAAGDRVVRTLLDDTKDLTKALSGTPFLQRVGYIKARVFEEMAGFLGETASRLGSVLLEGLADGRSIDYIKGQLVEQFDISSNRAETIARTEVIGALRRGRIEQAEEAAQELGAEIGMMWFSALSPTTRESHARRHGQVYSPDEVRDFYTEDGNGINCKCAQVEVVMVNGQPLQKKLVEREKAKRKDFFLKKAEDE